MQAPIDTIDVDGQAVPLPFRRERMLVLAHAGSTAHGTHLPPDEEFGTDDVDVMGIFVPTDEHLLGLRTPWQGETAYAGHVDYTFYALQKAGRLLLKGNPNVLSLLWVRDDDVLWRRPAYDRLRANRHLFATKAVYEPFVGYARAQLDKMGGGAYRGYMGARRKALVDRFGYDPKNAAHLIRLLRMAVDVLDDGELRIYRDADGDELREIKQGRWSFARVTTEAERLFRAAEAARDASRLPDRPDADAIERIIVAEMRAFGGQVAP